MKKLNKKLSLNKNVITKLNHITGGVLAPPVTYTCTATKPSATTCFGTTCNANSCGDSMAATCRDIDHGTMCASGVSFPYDCCYDC